MRNFLLVFMCSLVIGSAMRKVDPWTRAKTRPDHVGIAKEIKGFEIMYAFQAKLNGIRFKRPVSIGFSVIKEKRGKGKVVGLCTYGKNFREIDVDLSYWKEASWLTKRTLIYHEMTHCFCGRSHDFSYGVYPEAEDIKKSPFYMIERGILNDGCPMSIMYPYVLSDQCVNRHWYMYEKEMFERCKAY